MVKTPTRPRRVLIELEVASRQLGAPPDLVRRLVRAGLVVPLGRAESGGRWVEVDARRQIERVRALVAAGYAEKDIAVVIGKVERPEADPGKHPIYASSTFARLVAAPEASVQGWVEAGLLEPFGVTEDGGLLFTDEAREVARVLAALEQVGLGSLAADLASARSCELDEDATRALIASIRHQIAHTKAALGVLDAALPALEKRLAPQRRRLLTRKKVGTSRAPRTRGT